VRPRVRVELFDLATTEHAKADYPFDPRQHGVGLIVEAIVTGLEAVLASALRGSTASAGEWGHTTVMLGGRTCRCGALGCLEAYVGAEAILDQCGGPLPGSD
jgi:hypothetical protein